MTGQATPATRSSVDEPRFNWIGLFLGQIVVALIVSEIHRSRRPTTFTVTSDGIPDVKVSI